MEHESPDIPPTAQPPLRGLSTQVIAVRSTEYSTAEFPVTDHGFKERGRRPSLLA